MKARRWLHEMFSINLPSIIVSFSWIFIWALWPSAGRHGEEGQDRSPVRITAVLPEKNSAYKMPNVIAHFSVPGAGWIFTRKSSFDIGIKDPVERAVENTAVANMGFAPLDYSGRMYSCLAGTLFDDQILWSKSSFTTPSKNVQIPALSVEVSSALKNIGLEEAITDSLSGKGEGKLWSIGASIEVDGKGFVESVFLDKRSGISEIDAGFVACLYGKKFMETGKAVAGKIMLTYGVQ